MPTRPQTWPGSAFAPDLTTTCTIAVTATSGRIPIALNGAVQIELTNAGANWCFVAWGDVTVTATAPASSAGSYPLGPGQTKIVTILQDSQLPDPITNIAAICAAGLTTTFYATPGVGNS